MNQKTESLLLGTVTVKCENGFFDDFINELKKGGIEPQGVNYREQSLIAVFLSADMNRVAQIAENNGVELSIQKVSGLPRLLGKIKERAGVPLGLLFGFLLFAFLSCFLWRVEITAQDPEYIPVIMDLLEQTGVVRGAPLYRLDCAQIEKSIKDTLKTSGECTVNLLGCRLFVQHFTGDEHEQVLKPDDTGNIIAAKNGEILKIDVYSGTPLVKAGTPVVQGDVLVSGYQLQKDESQRPLAAKARVIARTQGFLSAEVRERVSVNGVIKAKDVYLPFLFRRYQKTIRDENRLKTASEYLLSTKATELPVGALRVRTTEFIKRDITLTPEQELLIALTDVCRGLIRRYELKSITERSSKLSVGSAFILEETVICTEDIARFIKNEPPAGDLPEQ